MLTEQRRQQILIAINQNPGGAVPVSELAERFGVTGMTIRRDLEYLEAQNLLHRVHGGAVSRIEGLTAAPFSQRRGEYSREKAQIAALAGRMVGDHEQILLDAGTTTLQIARELSRRRGLTVVTNSLSICALMARAGEGRVIVPGGELRPEEECMVGPVAARQAAQYSLDRAFISAAGFSLAKGVTDVDFPEVEVKQAMMRSAREVILAVDSSKWQADRLIRIAQLGEFHKILCDDGLPQSAIDVLRAQNIAIITPRTHPLELNEWGRGAG